MNFRRTEVKTIKVIPLCPCGGEYIDISHGEILTTFPAQKKFRCIDCGRVDTIMEPYWPHLETEEKEI